MTDPAAASPTNSTEACPVGGSRARWILATLVVMAIAIPVGVLLSFLAFLPYLLGLFFFLLLGLLLGAAQFRLGLPAAPLPGRWLVLGAAAVILTTYVTALAFEYRTLYRGAVKFAMKSHRTLDAAGMDRVRSDVPARIRSHLASRFPPGGLVGYVRWATRSGRMQIDTTADGSPITYTLSQGPLGVLIRLVATFALLSFGLASQVIALTSIPPPPDSHFAHAGEPGDEDA